MMNDQITANSSGRQTAPGFFELLWSYRKLLIIGIVGGVVAGVTIVLLKPVTYSSTATLIFPSAPASGLAALAGRSGGDLPSVPLLEGMLMVPQLGTSASTAKVILTSRQTRRNVLDRLKADGLDLAQTWKLSQVETLERLGEGMQCEEGSNGELRVGFRDTSAPRAKRIADAFLEELAASTKALGLNPAERSVAFLEEQLLAAEEDFAGTQHRLQKFQRAHHLVSLPDQAQAVAGQYAKLQADVAAAGIESDAAMEQANLLASHAERLIAACMDPVPAPGNSLSPLYQEVTRSETELALLRDRLTASHPDVLDKQRALAEARKRLKAETERQLAIVHSGSSPAVSEAVVKAAATNARLDGLKAALEDIQQRVDKLPSLQAEYIQLTADADASLTATKLFRQELEKAKIVAQTRGPMYIVIDPAELPEKRDPRGGAIILFVTILLGVSITCVLPYREWARLQQQYENSLIHSESTLSENS